MLLVEAAVFGCKYVAYNSYLFILSIVHAAEDASTVLTVQTIMAPLIIKVIGESTILRAAERGVMTVRISSTGKSQDTLSGDVTGTCRSCVS